MAASELGQSEALDQNDTVHEVGDLPYDDRYVDYSSSAWPIPYDCTQPNCGGEGSGYVDPDRTGQAEDTGILGNGDSDRRLRFQYGDPAQVANARNGPYYSSDNAPIPTASMYQDIPQTAQSYLPSDGGYSPYSFTADHYWYNGVRYQKTAQERRVDMNLKEGLEEQARRQQITEAVEDVGPAMDAAEAEPPRKKAWERKERDPDYTRPVDISSAESEEGDEENDSDTDTGGSMFVRSIKKRKREEKQGQPAKKMRRTSRADAHVVPPAKPGKAPGKKAQPAIKKIQPSHKGSKPAAGKSRLSPAPSDDREGADSPRPEPSTVVAGKASKKKAASTLQPAPAGLNIAVQGPYPIVDEDAFKGSGDKKQVTSNNRGANRNRPTDHRRPDFPEDMPERHCMAIINKLPDPILKKICKSIVQPPSARKGWLTKSWITGDSDMQEHFDRRGAMRVGSPYIRIDPRTIGVPPRFWQGYMENVADWGPQKWLNSNHFKNGGELRERAPTVSVQSRNHVGQFEPRPKAYDPLGAYESTPLAVVDMLAGQLDVTIDAKGFKLAEGRRLGKVQKEQTVLVKKQIEQQREYEQKIHDLRKACMQQLRQKDLDHDKELDHYRRELARQSDRYESRRKEYERRLDLKEDAIGSYIETTDRLEDQIHSLQDQLGDANRELDRLCAQRQTTSISRLARTARTQTLVATVSRVGNLRATSLPPASDPRFAPTP